MPRRDSFWKQRQYADTFWRYLKDWSTESNLLTRDGLQTSYKDFKGEYMPINNPKAMLTNFSTMLGILVQDGWLQQKEGNYWPSPTAQKPPRRRRRGSRKRNKSQGKQNMAEEKEDTGEKDERGRLVKVSVDQHVSMPKETDPNNISRTADQMIGPAQQAKHRQMFCVVCNVHMKVRDEYQKHIEGRKHRVQCMISALRDKKNSLTMNTNEVSIESDYDEKEGAIRVNLQEKVPCTISIIITNTSSSTAVTLECYELLKQVRIFQPDVITSRERPVIEKGETYQVDITLLAHHIGRYHTPLAFMFTRKNEPDRPFYIVRYLSARCSSALVDELQPEEEYEAPSRVAVQELDLEVVDGLPLARVTTGELEHIVPLMRYSVPSQLRRLNNRSFKPVPDMTKADSNKIIEIKKMLKTGLNEETYRERFQLLLHLEEIQMEVDIRQFDMDNTCMQRCPTNKRLLSLQVPGLAENRPSVLKGDVLYVRPLTHDGIPEAREYRGYVHEVQLEHVYLGFSDGLMEKYVENMCFSVRFTFSRHNLRVLHRAAELAEEHSLGKVLFPTKETVCQRQPIIPLTTELKLFNRNIESNKEQLAAVKHIVSGSSRPAPYLLFGPPGTGKTVTMVEAIKQVEHLIPSAHILACAPSNSAADLLAERLLMHMNKRKVLRLLAVSREWSTVPANIQECCNYDKSTKQFFYPSKAVIMENNYKVVVCTLTTASRLVSANFPAEYFTHVFIDEAGYAVEPEALVALAGILEFDLDLKDGGQVVLAGDPEQLGPVLRSPLAYRYGFGLSLLERYMKTCEVYQRDGSTDDVKCPTNNQHLLTKLVCNYRSHPDILKIPNECFYQDELIACADKLVRESLCSWDGLPKKGCPLVFHGVMSLEMREKKSPSFFNPEEATTVLAYVEQLLSARGSGIRVSEKEIGIITPYRKQVQKIRQALEKRKFRGIKVGSVEEFQGQERRIIIISTVRSSPEYLELDKHYRLGFVKNPKRFNVSVTRAKCLLIVVGNPLVLSRDNHWKKFLEYCIKSGTYQGAEYQLEPERLTDIIEQFAKVKLEDMGQNMLNSSVVDVDTVPKREGLV